LLQEIHENLARKIMGESRHIPKTPHRYLFVRPPNKKAYSLGFPLLHKYSILAQIHLATANTLQYISLMTYSCVLVAKSLYCV